MVFSNRGRFASCFDVLCLWVFFTRDFYIEYLDTEESLERLKYYAKFRFRDLERERYVVGLQQERTNKLRRRDHFRVKFAKIKEQQRQRFLNDSYLDEKGLRRRNYRHRTKDRLAYEKDKQTPPPDSSSNLQKLPQITTTNEAEETNSEGNEDQEYLDDEDYYDDDNYDEAESELGDVALDDELLEDRETEAFHGYRVGSPSISSRNGSHRSSHFDDIEELDEVSPQFQNRLDLSLLPTTDSSNRFSDRISARSEIKLDDSLEDLDVPVTIPPVPVAIVNPLPIAKDSDTQQESRKTKSRKGSKKSTSSPVTIQRESSASSVVSKLENNEMMLVIPKTKEEAMQDRRKHNKNKQLKQLLRRQKILATIIEANKALKKLDKAKSRQDHLNSVSISLMELHHLVKHAIMKSVVIDDVEDFDMMKAFGLNIHAIVSSPAIQFTSAILGQKLDPTSLDVELLTSSAMHPAGNYYYFLRDTHYHAAMTLHRNRITSAFALDPTRSKSDQTRPNSIGNVEYMHPAFFTTDFIRQPTRRSQTGLSYARIMKRKLNEGVQYRLEHGIRKQYDHIPVEDANHPEKRTKKVQFLEITPSIDTQYGKLIGRVTVKSIKLSNLLSIHVFEKNSPFVTLECGPWKFSTEVYSYAGQLSGIVIIVCCVGFVVALYTV
jgi:hypothetical protein